MAAKDEESEASTSKKQESIIPGYDDVLNFSSHALRSLMLATKASNDLPNAGDDFDYYSSFEGFRDVMDIESKRLLDSIQTMMRYHGIKGNIARNPDATELEDKFDVLVDANDQLLERVGIFLDEAAGLNKKEAPLVIASTPKQISGSWNKKIAKKGGFGSYRLLSAKHIPRPQAQFKDKIDNSSRPFLPKIKEKPHATKPLSESLIMAQRDDKTLTVVDEDNLESLVFPNPYQYELEHLTYPEEIFEDVTLQKSGDLGSTPYEHIRDANRLKALVQTLSNVKELAVDLEHHSYRSFQGITCLMQISTRTHDYVIDTIALRSELHALNEVFANPHIVKVLHGADLDIMWLQRDLGLYIVGMFDTGQASRVLSLKRFSLAYLLLTYCDVTADKQFQLADWRIRPLPEELIKYAREDTHYLLYIYDCLRKELLESGNEQKNLLRSVLQRSNQLCARTYMKPVFTPEKYLEFYQKQRKVFNNQQLHATKGLYAWRDRMGRTEDESEGYVLPNHMLLQIAELLPKDSQGILACCNPIPPFVRQNLPVLHAIVTEAREVSYSKPVIKATSPLKPSRKDHPKYQERMTDPLISPHDLSHRHEKTECGWNDSQLAQTDLVAAKSSLFGGATTMVIPQVAIATKPLISAFAMDRQMSQLSVSQAAERAARIKSAFYSPFEMFLPHNGLQSKSGRPVPASSMWKLKKHTTKVLKSTPKAVIRMADKVKIDQKEEEVGVLPFTLNQIRGEEEPTEKKKKKKVPVTSQQVQNKPTGPAKGSKNTSPTSQPSTTGGSSPDLGASETKKRKKDKLSIEDVEEAGFEGHDYTKSKFPIFSAPGAKKNKKKNKKKGQKDYDPDAKVLKSDFKNPSKPRLNPQKDVTFGNTSKAEQTSWPKR